MSEDSGDGEITREMEDAGQLVLLEWEGEVTRGTLARKIYSAMVSARPQPIASDAGMQSILNDVAAFHRACDVPVVETGPSEPATDRIDLRLRLINEEHGELTTAMYRGDLVAIADGIVDLIYVLIGTALEYGFLALPAVWAAVQRANMAKVDPATGRVAKRSDGKVLKPAGWQPPDVEGALYGGAPTADARTYGERFQEFLAEVKREGVDGRTEQEMRREAYSRMGRLFRSPVTHLASLDGDAARDLHWHAAACGEYRGGGAQLASRVPDSKAAVAPSPDERATRGDTMPENPYPSSDEYRLEVVSFLGLLSDQSSDHPIMRAAIDAVHGVGWVRDYHGEFLAFDDAEMKERTLLAVRAAFRAVAEKL